MRQSAALRGLKAVNADPKLPIVLVLLDQESSIALRARKEPRIHVHTSQLEYLTKQVPFFRFLKGQKGLAGLVPATQHMNFDDLFFLRRRLLRSGFAHARGHNEPHRESQAALSPLLRTRHYPPIGRNSPTTTQWRVRRPTLRDLKSIS